MNTQSQRRTFVVLFVLLALSVLTPVGLWLRSRDRAASAGAPRSPANVATGRAVDRRLAVVATPSAASGGAVRTAGSARAPSAFGLRLRELLHDLDPATARVGELVVVFSDRAAYQEFLARTEIPGFPIHGQLPELAAVRLVPGPEPTDEVIETLARALEPLGDEIADLGANRKMFLSVPSRYEETPNALATSVLSFLGLAGRESAADTIPGRRLPAWGRDFMIALLDTGVDAAAVNERIPRAGDPLLLGTLEAGYGTVPADLHGSNLAAVLGRVAPGARILGVRVTDDEGVSDLFAAAQGVVKAANVGADFIQLSPVSPEPALILSRAVALVADREITLVASTGGDPGTWPAADPRVIAIGSILTRRAGLSDDPVATPQITLDQAPLDSAASATIVAGALANVMSLYPGAKAADAWAALQFMTADPTAERAGPAAEFHAAGLQVLNLGWVETMPATPNRPGDPVYAGNLAVDGGGPREPAAGGTGQTRVLVIPQPGGRRGAGNRGGADAGLNAGRNGGRNPGRNAPVTPPNPTGRGNTLPPRAPVRGGAR